VRIQNGILVEHWDVIQDEAAEEQSKSGAPTFGNNLPKSDARILALSTYRSWLPSLDLDRQVCW